MWETFAQHIFGDYYKSSVEFKWLFNNFIQKYVFEYVVCKMVAICLALNILIAIIRNWVKEVCIPFGEYI